MNVRGSRVATNSLKSSKTFGVFRAGLVSSRIGLAKPTGSDTELYVLPDVVTHADASPSQQAYFNIFRDEGCCLEEKSRVGALSFTSFRTYGVHTKNPSRLA